MSDTNQGNTPMQDDDLPQPEVRKSKLGFSLIWLVPIIAALVGISLMVTHFTSAGPKITVTFLTAEGIEAKKGEFIWREPGSRHSAWCPEGGLMLAIFQVPNKFYEKDGRVTDPTGKIWDEVWGHTGKG